MSQEILAALERAARDWHSRLWALRTGCIVRRKAGVGEVQMRSQLLRIMELHGFYRAHEHALMHGPWAVEIFHQILRGLRER